LLECNVRKTKNGSGRKAGQNDHVLGRRRNERLKERGGTPGGRVIWGSFSEQGRSWGTGTILKNSSKKEGDTHVATERETRLAATGEPQRRGTAEGKKGMGTRVHGDESKKEKDRKSKGKGP